MDQAPAPARLDSQDRRAVLEQVLAWARAEEMVREAA